MRTKKFRLVLSRYWYPIGFYRDNIILALNLGYLKIIARG